MTVINNKNSDSVKLGLLVRLVSKPGKEAEVEKFLKDGLAIVNDEPGTLVWFAIRLNESAFGIFDAFSNEADRKAHLVGKVAEALFAKAPELFAEPPMVEQIDILASKLIS